MVGASPGGGPLRFKMGLSDDEPGRRRPDLPVDLVEHDPLPKERRVDDQRLVLASLAGGMDARPRGRPALELGEPVPVQALAQQVRGETLRREVDESNVEPGRDLLADHPARALPPERREDRPADPVRDPKESRPLVGGLDRPGDHPSAASLKGRLEHGELGGIPDTRDRDAAIGFPPGLGLERDQVEVGGVEHHRVRVAGTKDEEFVHSTPLQVREVRRIHRVLSPGDEGGDGHDPAQPGNPRPYRQRS